MERPIIAVRLGVLAVLIAIPARADMAASAPCAASLGPLARKIYQEAGQDLEPDTSIADLSRHVILPMEASSSLGMTEARQAAEAEAAGLCLKARFG